MFDCFITALHRRVLPKFYLEKLGVSNLVFRVARQFKLLLVLLLNIWKKFTIYVLAQYLYTY